MTAITGSDSGHRARSALVGVGMILAGALLLLVPAMLNGGPFIYADSVYYHMLGGSIADGIREMLGLSQSAPIPAASPVPNEAGAATLFQGPNADWVETLGGMSPFYSFFAYVLVSTVGVWGLAALQALWISWIVFVLFREFRDAVDPVVFLVSMALLGLASSVGFFVSFVMPDVFAAAFVGACALLIFGRRTSALERTLLWVTMAIAVSFHTTVLLLALAAAGFVVAFGILRRGEILRPWMTAGLIVLCIVPSQVGREAYKISAERSRGVEVYAPPYLTARVIADGTGARFLDEKCTSDTEPFSVCRFAEKHFVDHNHFLWGLGSHDSAFVGSDTPTRRALAREQFRFVLAVLAAYPVDQFLASLGNSYRQLVGVGLEDARETPAKIASYWGEMPLVLAMPQYAACKKNAAHCGAPTALPAWDIAVSLSVALSALVLVAYIALVARRLHAKAAETGGDDRLVQIAALVIFLLFANAVVCGALSGVHERYQSRLAWLLPALVLAALPLMRLELDRFMGRSAAEGR